MVGDHLCDVLLQIRRVFCIYTCAGACFVCVCERERECVYVFVSVGACLHVVLCMRAHVRACDMYFVVYA